MTVRRPLDPRFAAFVTVTGVLALLLGGCETGSSMRDFDVVYRFDNVRKTPEMDEWGAIRGVLVKHSTRLDVKPEPARVSGAVEVRSYSATANVPSVRTLEAIQTDLEQLAAKRTRGTGGAGERIEFSLARLQADYRSNVLAAGVEVSVSGIAEPRALVRVYPWEGAAPIPLTANRDGRWRTTLRTVPENRAVYASSTSPTRDAAGREITRYWRIDTATSRQDSLDRGEFEKLFPPGAPAKAAAPADAKGRSPESATLSRNESRDAQSIRAVRQREDAKWTKQREADDLRRSTLNRDATRAPRKPAAKSAPPRPAEKPDPSGRS